MKRVFSLIVLSILTFTLWANFQNFIQISQSSNCLFNGEKAIKITEEQLFIVYEEVSSTSSAVDLKMAISDNNGEDFSYTIIDTLLTNNINSTHSLMKPSLEILSSGRIIVYYINNSHAYSAISDDNGLSFTKELIASQLCADINVFNENDSIKVVLTTSSKEMQQYQYFTEKEESINSHNPSNPGLLYFAGWDELFGAVHSNDDILIRNLGGYPTFHKMVTSAGRILNFSNLEPAIYSLPMEEIFLGGFQELVPPIPLNPSAELLRDYALRPFDENADIVAVKIDGNTFESRLGYFSTSIDSFDVYEIYPDPLHPNIVPSGFLGTNVIEIQDTVWVVGPSMIIDNQSFFVESELWIEGCIAGNQTWGSDSNIYLTNDIYYNSTPIGTAPDLEGNQNETDYFGLISEESIFIKYKHYDPFIEARVSPNCSDIILYGAYAALGDGDLGLYGNYNCHYEGIFSYEYQHPHGSTPSFEYNGTLYDNIDLHKYFYPVHPINPNDPFGLHSAPPINGWGTCGFPYENELYYTTPLAPYGTDLPFYNPVWPETQETIDYLRGEIITFGSIIQRRKGYVRRSGLDPMNHPDNPANPDFYDLSSWDYGAVHPPTGYDKDYHYDSRLEENPLNNFFFNSESPDNILVFESNDFGNNYSNVINLSIDSPKIYINYQNGAYYFLHQNPENNDLVVTIFDNETSVINFSDFNFFAIEKIEIIGNEIYLLVSNNDLLYNERNIYKIDIENEIIENITTFWCNSQISYDAFDDTFITENNAKTYLNISSINQDRFLEIYSDMNDGDFNSFQQEIIIIPPALSNIKFDGVMHEQNLYLFFTENNSISSSYLYMSYSSLDLTPFLFGDFDRNNFVQAFDASNVLTASLEMINNHFLWQNRAGDVDGNLELQAYDASLILQYAVGLISSFPVENSERKNVTPQAKISIRKENDELIFSSEKNLFGLNLELDDNIVISDISTSLLFANEENKIALASAKPIIGDFLRIKFTQKHKSRNTKINLIVNQEKSQQIVLLNEDAEEIKDIDFTISYYPNPFNPTLNFEINLSEKADISIKIYNIKGKFVKEICNSNFETGDHKFKWNGKDNNNDQVSSGIYFTKTTINQEEEFNKVLLLK